MLINELPIKVIEKKKNRRRSFASESLPEI